VKILSAEQIRKVDAFTIENEPIASIDLMERASTACFNWLIEKYKLGSKFKIFVGSGNNGGDGLAISRLLFEHNYNVEVLLLTSPEQLSPDALLNYKRLPENLSVSTIGEYEYPVIETHEIVIDAIFGTGLSRELEGISARIVNLINISGAEIVSIDVPSGLNVDSKNTYTKIIRANYTLTFQMPKLSFFFSENNIYTGNWIVLDIKLSEEGISRQSTSYFYSDVNTVKNWVKNRPRFSHKGSFGNALLFAGQTGMMGAAVLAAKACMRAGVGLLTTRIVPDGYATLQTAVPESIADLDLPLEYLTSLPAQLKKHSAIGIGPGIGQHPATARMLYQLLISSNKPLVVDADALNILANNIEWMSVVPFNSIFTPHPGEFDRLVGGAENGYERHKKQIEFSLRFNVIVILKGAYTSITSPDGFCWFNSTGNPGMATAGSGDVLCGIVLSLLAQGYAPLHSAILGVYLHGLAGDIAAEEIGVHSLIASDINNSIGKAYKQILA
jgi:ADP-dependent NAD(P)H-hydrate dehydratase / NAD(P)H-hydrate epimerase